MRQIDRIVMTGVEVSKLAHEAAGSRQAGAAIQAARTAFDEHMCAAGARLLDSDEVQQAPLYAADQLIYELGGERVIVVMGWESDDERAMWEYVSAWDERGVRVAHTGPLPV